MAKYPHTVVFGFPTHYLVMKNHIKNKTLTEAPKVLNIQSASTKKVLENIRNIDWLERTSDFQFVILRKTTSEKISPELQDSDEIFEMNFETMQYIPFDKELLKP